MADEFTKAALYWIETFNKKVKEKIWMGKLIELLNERIKEWWKPYWDDYSITKIDEIWKSDWLYFVSFVWEDYPWPVNLEHILTKQAGLIKWLVENDKINLEEVEKINQTWNVYIRFWWDYEKVLMLLSISDTSIEDLLLYLK